MEFIINDFASINEPTGHTQICYAGDFGIKRCIAKKKKWKLVCLTKNSFSPLKGTVHSALVIGKASLEEFEALKRTDMNKKCFRISVTAY